MWPFKKKRPENGQEIENMGAWIITIKGHGLSHNLESPKDADRMTARFVDELKKAGHTVEYAEMQLVGDATDLTHAAGYEAGRAEQRKPPGAK